MTSMGFEYHEYYGILGIEEGSEIRHYLQLRFAPANIERREKHAEKQS